ncbi:MAG: putative kinase inhibitor protein [Burkholderiaceae bacterium]|nr:putative kinase inhibitor protein [Burkholderiaceae bacterium]
MSLTLTSPDFKHHQTMPAQYTCEGDNISPPLAWSAPPAGTQSLVLIVDDPDAPDPAAPKMTWVHWVLYNLPPTAGSLPAGVQDFELPGKTLVGTNDRKNVGYNGPCPPVGTHRYFHKLYAIDTVLPDLHAPTKTEVLLHIEGHVLAQAELVGLYRLTK